MYCFPSSVKRPCKVVLLLFLVLSLSLRSLQFLMTVELDPWKEVNDSNIAREQPTIATGSPMDMNLPSVSRLNDAKSRGFGKESPMDLMLPYPYQNQNHSHYPQAAIFFNGNPTEPKYLWTYSFSRVLRRVLPVYNTNVYTTKAREPDKLFEILPSYGKYSNDSRQDDKMMYVSELDPSNDTRLVEKNRRRNTWSTLSLIFTRATSVHELFQSHPSLFQFCRGVQVTNATCPVIIQFPIGQTPCESCNESWYTIIPDKFHVKPPSFDIWKRSQQIQQGIRPPTISETKWRSIYDANCSIAYVSNWRESKGQLRLVQELGEYYEYYKREGITSNWLMGSSNLTICFAGSHTKSQQLYQEATNLLTTIKGIRYVDFGEMNLIDQLTLFHASGKSILLTAGDFSPRVVYLSLVAGARVLTTHQAQIAQPVLDQDCLVTEWNGRYGHTVSLPPSVIERAALVEAFMERSYCSNPFSDASSKSTTTKTFFMAQSVLQEDLHYKPLIERALGQWRRLNFHANNGTRNYSCVEEYTLQCAKFFSILAKQNQKKVNKKEG